MAGTPEVLSHVHPHPSTSYPVLVPNTKGLAHFLSLRPHLPSGAFNEIAVFTAATDAFSLANTNCTVAESLARLEPVVADALNAGLRVRGYVSVVVECPYTGRVEPVKVREVAKRLMEMGCYEISLGDTVGKGTPDSIRAMLEEVGKDVPMGMLAGHVSGLHNY
jgi:hydroxymethylglutaryl-CoA lyase